MLYIFLMIKHDLPYYENVICTRMAFIEPFRTDWEVVSIGNLTELRNYLAMEWLDFQRAIIDDIRCGFSASYCVMSIYRTLKKFSRWFYSQRDTIKNALHTTVNLIVEKATIAKDIANVIELIWIPFMWERYDDLKKDSERLPESLTSAEIKQTHIKELKDEKREKAMRTLYSLIIGTSLEEKHNKFEIMREVLYGMKGKTVATYIQAALELKWLSEVPEFSIMKTFWGVEGTQGAISKMFSTVGGSLINENTLQNAKDELAAKLSQ